MKSSNAAMSAVRWNDTQSAITEFATAAANRSVCVTAHAVMYPPYESPEIPRRSGSANPRSTQRSIPAITSAKSLPPGSSITACANA